MPEITELYKDNWGERFDQEGALSVTDNGEGIYDFYVNMDNKYLLSELKTKSRLEPEILKSQYKFGMVLIGLSLLNSFEKEDNRDSESFDSETEVNRVTKAIAPMLLPMISALGELEN